MVDALPLDGNALAVIPPPSKALWAAELPRALWMGATWWRHRAELAAAPRGDGRTVMLLPGLFNGDGSNILLRRYLTTKGYRTHGWGLGRNLGVRSVGAHAEHLIARIEKLAEHGPVTLVGVSLATGPGKACYIPLGHGGSDMFAEKPDQVGKAQALAALKPMLEDDAVLKVFQNGKYDLNVLARNGIAVTPASTDKYLRKVFTTTITLRNKAG